MFSGHLLDTFEQNSGPFGHKNFSPKRNILKNLLIYLAEFSAIWQHGILPTLVANKSSLLSSINIFTKPPNF